MWVLITSGNEEIQSQINFLMFIPVIVSLWIFCTFFFQEKVETEVWIDKYVERSLLLVFVNNIFFDFISHWGFHIYYSCFTLIILLTVGPRTPKTLRRCWSNFDLPKSPIPEGKPVKLTTPKPLERSGKQTTVIIVEKITNNKNCTGPTGSKIPAPKIYMPKHTQRKVTIRGKVTT